MVSDTGRERIVLSGDAYDHFAKLLTEPARVLPRLSVLLHGAPLTACSACGCKLSQCVSRSECCGACTFYIEGSSSD